MDDRDHYAFAGELCAVPGFAVEADGELARVLVIVDSCDDEEVELGLEFLDGTDRQFKLLLPRAHFDERVIERVAG